MTRVKSALLENKSADDQLAKDRLRAKRIKSKGKKKEPTKGEEQEFVLGNPESDQEGSDAQEESSGPYVKESESSDEEVPEPPKKRQKTASGMSAE